MNFSTRLQAFRLYISNSAMPPVQVAGIVLSVEVAFHRAELPHLNANSLFDYKEVFGLSQDESSSKSDV